MEQERLNNYSGEGKKPKSVYHSILNAFFNAGEDVFVLGTTDIIKYSNFSEKKVREALEVLDESNLLDKYTIGNSFAWTIHPNETPHPGDETLRLYATEITKANNEYNAEF